MAIIANVAVYAPGRVPARREVGRRRRPRGRRGRRRCRRRSATSQRREALVTGKTRAEQELSTFYDKVLPADLTAARRLTYAALPALARKTNVQVSSQSRIRPRADREGCARRASEHPHGSWQGDYESLRQFIYELESAPEFVIIDDVTLTQSDPRSR